MTCSHTFAAANLVQGGTPGLHPELCDAKGVIDNAKVLQLCPSWAKPLSEGIECIIFRREVEEEIPLLPALLSKAGNQSHDVHSKETKVQLMLDLSQLFVSKKRFTDTAESAQSWAEVAREMEVMKPQFAGKVAEAAEFAAKWSGGDE